VLEKFWVHFCRRDPGTLATWLFFLSVVGTLTTLSFTIAPSAVALNCAVIIVGAAVGWMVGVVLSPDSPGQTGRFEGAWAALATIMTGYVVAKGEASIARLLEPAFLFSEKVGFRVLAFVGSLVASLILVFVHREYSRTRCAGCHAKNPVGAKFCGSCGTVLPRDEPRSKQPDA